ncbi:MAG: hypothetical protein BMS9Abin11_0359 [Gammaproteobacteria bacterium]|nr:MAG: hypothetical protein BMS9Abin11_0359 [Gammaproteobacteria bacterium]
MCLATREANRILTNMKYLGIIEKSGLKQNDINRGKYLISSPPIDEARNGADQTYEFIKQIIAGNGYDAEFICSRNIYREMDDTLRIITISECSTALNDDLALWCRLHNKLFHYCSNNDVYALVI